MRNRNVSEHSFRGSWQNKVVAFTSNANLTAKRASDSVQDKILELKSFGKRNKVYIKRWVVILLFVFLLYETYSFFFKSAEYHTEAGHPFLVKASQVTIKTFEKAEEVDFITKQPCEHLSLLTIESGVYSSLYGVKFLLANLFQIQKKLADERSSVVVSPKMLNFSACDCANEIMHSNGTDGDHNRISPNPCIATMVTSAGNYVHMINPVLTRSTENSRDRSVLVTDEQFPLAPAVWIMCHDTVFVAFRDWTTREVVKDVVSGRDACVLQIALALLNDGKTTYDLKVDIFGK